MQCVILAAGEGVRMRPLTLTTPKPLLKVGDRPLLERIFESAPPEVDEFIVVVGYLGEQIRAYFGSTWRGKHIHYVEQPEKLGTYHALLTARSLLREGLFLVLYADDLHSPESIHEIARLGKPAIMVYEVADPRRFGAVLTNPDGTVREIEEKPEHPKSNLATCGPSVLSARIFDFPAPRSAKGEYFLTDSINLMAQHEKVYVVRCKWWVPVGYPEDLGKAEEFLRQLSTNDQRPTTHG